MEAAIGGNHQNGGSGPSIFDFVFQPVRQVCSDNGHSDFMTEE
jgi:hypothetical protein